MAETSNRSMPWLAFLIGGLIVAVAIVGYLAYARGALRPSTPDLVDVDVNLPKPPPIPDAPKLPDVPVPTPK